MAKAAASKSSESKPKKGGGLAAYRKRRRARQEARANPSPRSNPGIVADFTHVLLPGFAAYAATRFLQRVIYTIVQKRWPKYGKHAHAAAGLVAAGGVWWQGHRIKALAPYHDSIVSGAAIAAVQGVIQTYVPRLGWVVSDCKPEDVRGVGAGGAQQQMTAPSSTSAYNSGDPLDYLEDDMPRQGRGRGAPVASPMDDVAADDGNVELDPDIAEELGVNEDVGDLYSGAFAN